MMTINWKAAVAVLCFLICAGGVAAQEFPLTAHVKEIRQDKHTRISDGDGGTQTWHLVIAQIDGHTYGLEVHRRSFHTLNTWLHVGDYPCRRTKDGFEFQYEDNGKVHKREFDIVSEDSAP
jgi:hypothetical protein